MGNISATSLIISLSFSPNKKDAVLIVGKKEPGKDVEVVNAFEGDNAFALYELLTQPIWTNLHNINEKEGGE